MQRFDGGPGGGGGSVNFSNKNGNATTTTTSTAALTTLTRIPSGANGSAPVQVLLVATTSAADRHVERQQQNQSLPMGAAASAAPGRMTTHGTGQGTAATTTTATTMLDRIADMAAANRRFEWSRPDTGANFTFQPPSVGPGEQSGDAFAGLIAANQSGAATLATNMFMMTNSLQHHSLHYYQDQYQDQYNNYHSQQDHNYHHNYDHNDYNQSNLNDNANARLLLAGSDATSLASIVSKLSAWQLALVALLISLILISIVGNCLVCIAIFTDRRLRKLGNAFIVSLAIADLFVSCLVMTFALCNDLMDYWMFGEWFCDIWISFDIMCCTASILNLCAISLDRFIHIKDCLLYNQLMTRRVAISAVIIIWIISALVSFVPINLGWHKPSQYPSSAPFPPGADLLLTNTSNNGNNFEQYLPASHSGNNNDGPPPHLTNNFAPTHLSADTASRSKRSVPWGSQNQQLNANYHDEQFDSKDRGLRRASSLLRNVRSGARDNQAGAIDDGRPKVAQESALKRNENLKWTLSRSNDVSEKEYENVQEQEQRREPSSVGGDERARADHQRQANRKDSQQNGANRAAPTPQLSPTRANNAIDRQGQPLDSISSPARQSSSGGGGGGGGGGQLLRRTIQGASSSGSTEDVVPSVAPQLRTSLHNSRAPRAQVDSSNSRHELEQTMSEGDRILSDTKNYHYYDYYYKLAGGGSAKEWADQVESNPQDGSREQRQQIGQKQRDAKGGGGDNRHRLAEFRQRRQNARQKRLAREQPEGSAKSETRSPTDAPNSSQLPQCMLTLTPTYAIISSAISFYIPCLIMLGLYSKLFACARRHVKNIRAITRAPNPIGGMPPPPPTAAASNTTTRSASGHGAGAGLYNVTRLGSYRHQNQRRRQQQSINRSAIEQSNCLTGGTPCPTNTTITTTTTNSSYNSPAHKPTTLATNGASKCARLKLHHRARNWIKFGRAKTGNGVGSDSARGPGAQEAGLMAAEPDRRSGPMVETMVADLGSGLNRDRAISAPSKATSSTSRSTSASSSRSPTPSSSHIPTIDACSITVATKTSASCSPGGGTDAQANGIKKVGEKNAKRESSCGKTTDLASGNTTAASLSVSAAAGAKRSNDETINHHHHRCGPDSCPREDEPFLARPSESITNETDSHPCCDKATDSSQVSGATCDSKQPQLVPGAQVMSKRKPSGQQTRKQNFSAAALKLNLTPQQTPISGRPPAAVTTTTTTTTNHDGSDYYYYQQQQQQNKQQTSQLATHKAAITLGIIMGTFLFCWVPFFCLNIIKAFFGDSIPSSMFRAFTWLGYANSALNPIIYGIHNTEFRNAFNRIFFKHLTLKNGRQYLNRRFSYDLRHHHHHHQQQPGQQLQQQQQQQQPLGNNHHRHHQHYQDQLQPVPVAHPRQ